eukprot:722920_1
MSQCRNIALYIITICIIPHYSAKVIFYDDCSSLSQWSKTEMSDEIQNLSEVTLSNFECESDWCFQIDAGNAITSTSIPIQNYDNITLQYSIKPFFLENNDTCNIYYTENDNNWTLLPHSQSHTNNIWQNITIQSLPITSNSDSIKLRFYVTKYSNEIYSCFIDEIHLIGTHISKPELKPLRTLLIVGIIILSSITFLIMICFCKYLSEQVEACMNAQVSEKQSGSNLSFLEEEKERIREDEEAIVRIRSMRNLKNLVGENRKEINDEMNPKEVERMRKANFALASPSMSDLFAVENKNKTGQIK